MRSEIVTTMIVGLMALSACMSAAEKAEREAKLSRVRAESLMRLNQAKQEQARRLEQEGQQAEKDPAFIQWQKDSEPYIRSLCTTQPGSEHAYAWENYRIAVSADEGHAAEARRLGRLIQCAAAE